jgi:DNA polymerase III, delta subunit
MGEEPYFIDLITDALIDNVVPEEYKDFDMTIMYGADVSINTIVSTAKRYPMMSQYQLIVVKEAQMVDSMEKLEFYTRMPMPTTVLVINYKTKTFDARTKAMKDIASMGIVFNSKKVYENQLPSMVKNHVMAKGFSIDEKAVHMMCDFIGADLNRLFSEIEKTLHTCCQTKAYHCR